MLVDGSDKTFRSDPDGTMKVCPMYSVNCNNACGDNAYFWKCIEFGRERRSPFGVIFNRKCVMHWTTPVVTYAISASANASLICYLVGRLAAQVVVLGKRAYVPFRRHHPHLWSPVPPEKLVSPELWGSMRASEVPKVQMQITSPQLQPSH